MVALSRRKPRERHEAGRDCSPNHRRVRADGEDVARDGGERNELGHEAPGAEEEREHDRAAGDGADLQPVDCEHVVEAGRAEAREQAVAEPLRLAEDDAVDDRAPLAGKSVRGVVREPAV